MADDNKAVGPLATAKLVALIKAALDGKLDKTGGTIFGDLKVKTNAEGTGNIDVEGEIRVKSGTAHLRDVHATGTVHSDLMAEAPLLNLRAPLAEKSVQVTQDGDTAVKMECFDGTLSKGYARLEIGTPAGDNDAATKAYVDGRTHDYYDVTVISAADAAQAIDGGIISVRGSADKTVAEIAAAYAAGAIVRCIYGGNIMPLVRAEDGSYSFAGTGANYGVARDGNITVTIMSTTSNGDTTLITSAAGELPIPDSDVSQNGCALVVRDGQWMYSEDKLIPATPTSNGLMSAADKTKLDGVETGANKTVVDAALDAASENPVQNKAVKVALDSKLSTRGGEISASLRVGQTVSAEGSVSVGRTSTDTGIHFEKAASDAGRISHGSDPMTGVSPIARLKVAAPTEDDDAATKAYVDGSAVRYDAAQTLDKAQQAQARENVGAASAFAPILTSPVMIRKEGATDSAGVYLSTIDIGEKHAEIRLEDVNKNAPVAIANLRTPTGAGTDDYAATKGYVDSKVASGSGVTVDTAMSGTSTNPVQNKVVKAALDKKAGTAVATASANGLMSKADKTKLDGIAAGATKITIDSAMSGSSNNPVANHVVKQYVDDKVAAAGSNVTVDVTLSSTSTNPVQNKAVKAAVDAKADKTALDAKADKTALNAKMDKSGGTFTGNVYGKYFCGTWLQSSAASNLGRTPGKIAVLDDSGWVYYRTPSELFADLGIANAIKSHVDTAIAAAINSAY